MILPTIHSNGTSARMLAEGYSAARIAVEDALVALAAVEFNGRDYYPQGSDAFTAATTEHDARLNALRNVATELAAIEKHCCNLMRTR